MECFDHSWGVMGGESRVPSVDPAAEHPELPLCWVVPRRLLCCRAATPGHGRRVAVCLSLCPYPHRHGRGLDHSRDHDPYRGIYPMGHHHGHARRLDRGLVAGRAYHFVPGMSSEIFAGGFCRLFFGRPSYRLCDHCACRSLFFGHSPDRAVRALLHVDPC